MGHDMLSAYSVKAVEYLIAVSFLLLFVPFWKFVNARPTAPALEAAPGWLGQMVEWFRVPAELRYHPGHAWAKLGAGDLVTVGVDDFASKLVGRPAALRLPGIGERIAQGERAWSLTCDDGKTVEMLAPVDGTVVAVNPRLASSPSLVTDDPYGDGWLVKVKPARVGADVKQLLSGRLARRWMEEACEGLQSLMSPELGRVCQDGGVPADGMARNLDPVHWDDLARRFLLT